jgi:cytochrome c-type biogenesis protein CcmE
MSAMPKKAARAVVSVVILFGALSLLLFTTMSQDALAYRHVDEVAKNPHEWYGKNFQLHGFVDGEVLVKPATLDYKFTIETKGHKIPAIYKGVVPDTFKTGAEVVLTGRLEEHAFVVEPGGVLAKCPSKYEAAGPNIKAN